MNATVDPMAQCLAWFKYLSQGETWVPNGKPPLPISEMDATWRYNAANWLLRRASHLAAMYGYGLLYAFDESPEREVIGERDGEPVLGDWGPAREIPAEVLDELLRQDTERANNPETWLKTTPLYQVLVKELPDGVADLAKHWSTCDLRTGKASSCSCWRRHLSECPVNQLRNITATCCCRDNSPDWTL